jgi:Fic family protein
MVGQPVPLPAPYIPELMRDLERFLNTNTYPPLIKTGLGHAQFEIIHPFSNGNGRIGRLLIILGLINDGLLSFPFLCPSYYFKRFRNEYYAYLDGVKLKGDWLSWLKFYLEAINETAIDTVARVDNIIRVIKTYKKQFTDFDFRDSETLLNTMLATPVFSVTQLARDSGYSFVGASVIVKKLEHVGVVKQRRFMNRYKTYCLEEYMLILEADTAFISPAN